MTESGPAPSFALTDHARSDLGEIWEFIASDNLDAADRLLDELEEAMSEAARLPLLGHRREDLTEANVRFWRVRSYLVIYDPESQPLTILRVLSGFRDVATLL